MKFCGSCGKELRFISSDDPTQHSKSPTYERDYSGFWLRAVAGAIDLILSQAVIFVLIMLVGLPVVFSIASTATEDEIELISNAIAYPLAIFLQWIYYTVPESSKWQATPGKKMLGLVVVDKDGQKIGFGRANARYWSKILSVLILFIGYVMVAFTEKKQGLHDKIADTYVIKM